MYCRKGGIETPESSFSDNHRNPPFFFLTTNDALREKVKQNLHSKKKTNKNHRK